jgi:hypothetical protein
MHWGPATQQLVQLLCRGIYPTSPHSNLRPQARNSHTSHNAGVCCTQLHAATLTVRQSHTIPVSHTSLLRRMITIGHDDHHWAMIITAHTDQPLPKTTKGVDEGRQPMAISHQLTRITKPSGTWRKSLNPGTQPRGSSIHQAYRVLRPGAQRFQLYLSTL